MSKEKVDDNGDVSEKFEKLDPPLENVVTQSGEGDHGGIQQFQGGTTIPVKKRSMIKVSPSEDRIFLELTQELDQIGKCEVEPLRVNPDSPSSAISCNLEAANQNEEKFFPKTEKDMSSVKPQKKKISKQNRKGESLVSLSKVEEKFFPKTEKDRTSVKLHKKKISTQNRKDESRVSLSKAEGKLRHETFESSNRSLVLAEVKLLKQDLSVLQDLNDDRETENQICVNEVQNLTEKLKRLRKKAARKKQKAEKSDLFLEEDPPGEGPGEDVDNMRKRYQHLFQVTRETQSKLKYMTSKSIKFRRSVEEKIERLQNRGKCNMSIIERLKRSDDSISLTTTAMENEIASRKESYYEKVETTSTTKLRGRRNVVIVFLMFVLIGLYLKWDTELKVLDQIFRLVQKKGVSDMFNLISNERYVYEESLSRHIFSSARCSSSYYGQDGEELVQKVVGSGFLMPHELFCFLSCGRIGTFQSLLDSFSIVRSNYDRFREILYFRTVSDKSLGKLNESVVTADVPNKGNQSVVMVFREMKRFFELGKSAVAIKFCEQIFEILGRQEKDDSTKKFLLLRTLKYYVRLLMKKRRYEKILESIRTYWKEWEGLNEDILVMDKFEMKIFEVVASFRVGKLEKSLQLLNKILDEDSVFLLEDVRVKMMVELMKGHVFEMQDKLEDSKYLLWKMMKGKSAGTNNLSERMNIEGKSLWNEMRKIFLMPGISDPHKLSKLKTFREKLEMKVRYWSDSATLNETEKESPVFLFEDWKVRVPVGMEMEKEVEIRFLRVCLKKFLLDSKKYYLVAIAILGDLEEEGIGQKDEGEGEIFQEEESEPHRRPKTVEEVEQLIEEKWKAKKRSELKKDQKKSLMRVYLFGLHPLLITFLIFVMLRSVKAKKKIRKEKKNCQKIMADIERDLPDWE